MFCRGKKTREELIKKYSIIPVAHVQLLNGQEKKSCTGDILTDSYYIFSYNSSDGEGTFYCGSHAASHFLALLGKSPIPLFNPLSSTSSSTSSKTGSAKSKSRYARTWNITAKQLSDAINILMITWDSVPYGKLAEIKLNLEKYFYNEPFVSKIEYVNKIISYDSRKRTIQEMLRELSLKNTLRSFDFSDLNQKLKHKDIDSNFG